MTKLEAGLLIAIIGIIAAVLVVALDWARLRWCSNKRART